MDFANCSAGDVVFLGLPVGVVIVVVAVDSVITAGDIGQIKYINGSFKTGSYFG